MLNENPNHYCVSAWYHNAQKILEHISFRNGSCILICCKQCRAKSQNPPCLLFCLLAPQRSQSKSLTVCPFELGALQSAGQPFCHQNRPTWTCAEPHNHPGISKYPSRLFSCGGWGGPGRDLHLQSCVFPPAFVKNSCHFSFSSKFLTFLPWSCPRPLISCSILLPARASHLSRWHLMWSGTHPWAYNHWLIKTHMRMVDLMWRKRSELLSEGLITHSHWVARSCSQTWLREKVCVRVCVSVFHHSVSPM